jgi:hypothetical protein
MFFVRDDLVRFPLSKKPSHEELLAVFKRERLRRKVTRSKTVVRKASAEAGIAVVRRNTEEVQGRGNFEVFEELFADDFADHTPTPENLMAQEIWLTTLIPAASAEAGKAASIRMAYRVATADQGARHEGFYETGVFGDRARSRRWCHGRCCGVR